MTWYGIIGYDYSLQHLLYNMTGEESASFCKGVMWELCLLHIACRPWLTKTSLFGKRI